KVDGVISSELVLAERTYQTGDELAGEIQKRIDADDNIGNRNVTVEWVDQGDTGYLKFTSGTYGSRSTVDIDTTIDNAAYTALGLTAGLSSAGADVAGTINGESATGHGQLLTGDKDNPTTAGLKLRITLNDEDMVPGVDGTVTVRRGLGFIVDKTLDNITKSIDGSIARRTSALEAQIDDIDDRIVFYEERLARKREQLYQEFLEMEEILSQFQSQGTYLQAQLAGLQNNWNQILGNK
ncbi:MAG: flagellar filament capping protein FliD, partial [Candidatus Zixiibacteriota bacterium]